VNKFGLSISTKSSPTITYSSVTFDTLTTVSSLGTKKRLKELPPYEVLLDDGFYGKPIILETEPDQEFLGFMLETKPLELIYQGPTNVSQVLSPFSASPPKVLLSGFRSRCHIVVRGAFPELRIQQGLDQLIHLYTLAGFPKEELHNISTQIMIQHQNIQPHEQKCSHFATESVCTIVVLFLRVLFCGFGFVLLFFLYLHLLSSFCQLGSNLFALSPRPLHSQVNMDHAQGRAFHHHLARAIMHLNYLAGLLPFFEPSIEWDDPTTDHQF